MDLDPSTRKGSLMTASVVRLMDGLLRILGRTWRLELTEGRELIEELSQPGDPMLVCLWHNRILPGAGFFLGRIDRSGRDVTLLTSASRDGELADRFVRIHGGRVVRGSSTRGGARALRGIVRAVRDHASSPIVIPDGPKGPPYRFKNGVVRIAQLTGIPVLGLGLAAERFWILGTWDRMVFPKPFSRIVVTADRLGTVPRGLPREGLEEYRRAFETGLATLTRAAEAAVGAEDPLRPDPVRQRD